LAPAQPGNKNTAKNAGNNIGVEKKSTKSPGNIF
jgi:hypothetical protein